MKQLFFIALSFSLFACNQRSENKVQQTRIDSLESKLASTYKPGFGEFMSSIQAHHAKLWFAGQNENWELADFEIQEIREAIEDIRKFQTERKESQVIGMINPSLDSIDAAVQQKNPVLFKTSYTLLTNTCNNCHRAVNFGFNVVKVPGIQTFSNQDFRSNQSK